jgi:hypothetical protein
LAYTHNNQEISMSTSIAPAIRTFACSAMVACVGIASAAEGFEPRYNLAGSLGGEMFAPPDQRGWLVGWATTSIKVGRVTGNDGNSLTQPIPGGIVQLPAPLPAALNPSFGPGVAAVDGTGTMTRHDFVFAYLSAEEFGGGRLAFGIDIPFARKSQSIVVGAPTPSLGWPANTPVGIQTAVQGQFAGQYQAALGAQSANASGEVTGFGDAELLAGWQYVRDKLRVLAGASLVLPTGKYSADPKPDIGVGNFYTFRPALQLAYLPTPEWAFAAKYSLGLNTRNRDNQLRSGNWMGFETAAGYKTPIGVIGLHAIRLQQYQDDDNNPFGASRARSTNGGAFFTTLVPGIDAALTIQYIKTFSSRNIKDATFTQARLIKVF